MTQWLCSALCLVYITQEKQSKTNRAGTLNKTNRALILNKTSKQTAHVQKTNQIAHVELK